MHGGLGEDNRMDVARACSVGFADSYLARAVHDAGDDNENIVHHARK